MLLRRRLSCVRRDSKLWPSRRWIRWGMCTNWFDFPLVGVGEMRGRREGQSGGGTVLFTPLLTYLDFLVTTVRLWSSGYFFV